MKKMKKIIALALMALSLFAIALPALAQSMYVNCPANEYVNVRKTASTSATVLAKLHRGNMVDVVSTSGSWTRISAPVNGYIMSQFLSNTDPGSGGVPSYNHPQTKAQAFGGSTLKRGHVGYAVKNIQLCLSLSEDGIFGAGTESAVRTFQSNNGLAVDGQVGAATKTALWSKYQRTLMNYGWSVN